MPPKRTKRAGKSTARAKAAALSQTSKRSGVARAKRSKRSSEDKPASSSGRSISPERSLPTTRPITTPHATQKCPKPPFHNNQVTLQSENRDAVDSAVTAVVNGDDIKTVDSAVTAVVNQDDIKEDHLPPLPPQPYLKGNNAYTTPTVMYIVKIAIACVETKIRGNLRYGNEIRFNASEISRQIYEYDSRCKDVIGQTPAASTKLQRHLRKMASEYSKWLRGGLPATASVKDPNTIKQRQTCIARKEVRGTDLTVGNYFEHMERVGILCGEMGTYRPPFGASSVGAGSIDRAVQQITPAKRTATYDVKEGDDLIGLSSGDDSDHHDNNDSNVVRALQLVESDTDDDSGSPSCGAKVIFKKGRSVTEGAVDSASVTVTPQTSPQEKKGAVLIEEKNMKEVQLPRDRPGGASGRGKRGPQPTQPLSEIDKFVQVIQESSRAQSDREQARLKMEQDVMKEKSDMEKLRFLQNLVNDNPGNNAFVDMLEKATAEMSQRWFNYNTNNPSARNGPDV